MVKFSVVIVLRSINEYVHEAMPYFQGQKLKDFEIIIVSEKKEKVSFPQTNIFYSGRVNPAQARNIGVKKAKGEIIAFIDDDAYPSADWLETAAKEFENKEIIAIGGPSIIPHNATFFQRVSNKVYELSSEKTGPRYGRAERHEIDDWPTCNFFVRKKDFERVKGFNSQYWGGEDTQLCYSLLKTGKKIVYIPELIIYHHPRKNLKQHLKQTFFWGMWRGFFMRLYKESRQLTFFIPSIFIIWLIAGGLVSWVSHSFAYLYAISIFLYSIYLIILGIRSRDIGLAIPVMVVTCLTHISYGLGLIKGISSSSEPIKKTLNPAENIKVKEIK